MTTMTVQSLRPDTHRQLPVDIAWMRDWPAGPLANATLTVWRTATGRLTHGDPTCHNRDYHAHRHCLGDGATVNQLHWPELHCTQSTASVVLNQAPATDPLDPDAAGYLHALRALNRSSVARRNAVTSVHAAIGGTLHPHTWWTILNPITPPVNPWTVTDPQWGDLHTDINAAIGRHASVMYDTLMLAAAVDGDQPVYGHGAAAVTRSVTAAHIGATPALLREFSDAAADVIAHYPLTGVPSYGATVIRAVITHAFHPTDRDSALRRFFTTVSWLNADVPVPGLATSLGQILTDYSEDPAHRAPFEELLTFAAGGGRGRDDGVVTVMEIATAVQDRWNDMMRDVAAAHGTAVISYGVPVRPVDDRYVHPKSVYPWHTAIPLLWPQPPVAAGNVVAHPEVITAVVPGIVAEVMVHQVNGDVSVVDG